jgi:hypothetical protein
MTILASISYIRSGGILTLGTEHEVSTVDNSNCQSSYSDVPGELCANLQDLDAESAQY